MNTKKVTDKAERKKTETRRAKKAAPEGKTRSRSGARFATSRKIRHQAQGQRKR